MSEDNTIEKLAKLEANYQNIDRQLTRMNENIISVGSRFEEKINSIIKVFDQRYVSKDRFAPIQSLVYGFVGLILLTVIGAIIATVVSAKGGA